MKALGEFALGCALVGVFVVGVCTIVVAFAEWLVK
jgi:hypothetical protein